MALISGFSDKFIMKKHLKSTKSICKLLSELYDGKWYHVPFHNAWHKIMEDDTKYESVCGTCSCDEFENIHFTGYYHYSSEKGATFLGWNLRSHLESILIKNKIE